MRGKLAAGMALLVSACGGEEEAVAAEPVRRVTVFEVAQLRPRAENLVPGVVEPYRQSDVGFDVGGRLLYVADVGQELQGPLLDNADELIRDGEGQPVREGDVLARLDDTRYVQALRSLELRKQSTELQLASQRVDLERIASADLTSARAQAAAAATEVAIALEDVTAAQADRDLAQSILERNRPLVESGAVSLTTIDQNEATLASADARLERARNAVQALEQAKNAADALVSKAEGSLLFKEAQIETTRAQLAELQNEMDRAQLDLDSCVLRAPFTGRVTVNHAQPGAWVSPGAPVAHMVLMTPVRVAITASADLERALLPGMGVRVHPSYGDPLWIEQGIVATVYEKGQVADPATRTFRVGVMTRNPLSNGQLLGVQRPVSDIFPVISLTTDDSGPFWINMDCVLEEGGKSYVLQLPDLQLNKMERDMERSFRPQRVEVSFADEWERVDQWTIRRLEETGGLVAGDALVVDPARIQTEEIRMDSSQWALRPGDLVRVALQVGLPPEGLWVPVTAISELNGTTSVLRVAGERLERVPVELGEAEGALRRVVGGALSAGDRIVARGVAFAVDGERVQVIAEESL